MAVRFFLAFIFVLFVKASFLQADTTDQVRVLPTLSSQQKPPIGRQAADAYIRSTQNTPHRHKKRSYSLGIYFSHFTSSRSDQSPFSPQQRGFSSGLIYLQKISSSEHILFRGELSLERSRNDIWYSSLTPSVLFSFLPVYVGLGIPSLNLMLPNNTFYMDWQLLTGIRFEVLSFLNFFIEAKWKNPFNIFTSSQRKTLHLLAGVSLLF